ncbi:hypothetical protein HK104_000424 [Borealophlyctis nickersoniae]|nr:hypothetical protein HK104_000424 [Borealophlyctis nickersoniae]
MVACPYGILLRSIPNKSAIQSLSLPRPVDRRTGQILGNELASVLPLFRNLTKLQIAGVMKHSVARAGIRSLRNLQILAVVLDSYRWIEVFDLMEGCRSLRFLLLSVGLVSPGNVGESLTHVGRALSLAQAGQVWNVWSAEADALMDKISGVRRMEVAFYQYTFDMVAAFDAKNVDELSATADCG